MYDLRSLTGDEIDELGLALQDRLAELRSIRTETREDSGELTKRRNRVEALMQRVKHLRHDPTCVKKGDAARSAYKDAIKSTANGMTAHAQEDEAG